MMADTGSAPMVTINVDEGPAYGAAILASVAAGMYGTVEEGCDAIIQEISRLEPNAAAVKAYDPWFDEYQALYGALAPRFKAMAGLLG
jgi:xylulokinase